MEYPVKRARLSRYDEHPRNFKVERDAPSAVHVHRARKVRRDSTARAFRDLDDDGRVEDRGRFNRRQDLEATATVGAMAGTSVGVSMTASAGETPAPSSTDSNSSAWSATTSCFGTGLSTSSTSSSGQTSSQSVLTPSSTSLSSTSSTLTSSSSSSTSTDYSGGFIGLTPIGPSTTASPVNVTASTLIPLESATFSSTIPYVPFFSTIGSVFPSQTIILTSSQSKSGTSWTSGTTSSTSGSLPSSTSASSTSSSSSSSSSSLTTSTSSSSSIFSSTTSQLETSSTVSSTSSASSASSSSTLSETSTITSNASGGSSVATGAPSAPSTAAGGSNSTSNGANEGNSSPTPAIVGGVVGGLVGFALLCILLLLLLRRLKRRKAARNGSQLPDSSAAGPSFLPAPVVGLLSRSVTPADSQPQTSERGFSKVPGTGRKLPSAFSPAMEGPAGGAAAGAAAVKEKEIGGKDIEAASPVSPTHGKETGFPMPQSASSSHGPGFPGGMAAGAAGATGAAAIVNPFEKDPSEHSSPEDESPLREADNGNGNGVSRQHFDAPPGAGLPPLGMRPSPARTPMVVAAPQDSLRPPSTPSTVGTSTLGHGSRTGSPSVETVPEERSVGRSLHSLDGSHISTGSRFREDM